MNITRPSLTLMLVFSTLIFSSLTYIDIQIEVSTSSADVSLNVPLAINDLKYQITLSLENKEQFLVAPGAMPHSQKRQNSKEELIASMHVWSLEGYTLEGWKRFFLEVFLFEDSKYSHAIFFNVSGVKTSPKQSPMSNGLMTIGPQLQKNQIYNLIKEQTSDFFKDDIVSLYTAPGGNDIRMQLGGYQQQNARGYNTGVRFYEKTIETTENGKGWVLPVNKISIAREKSNKWEAFSIPFSTIKAKLSLQSQFIVLPSELKEDLETAFQTDNIECSFSKVTFQLQCSNISSIDEALTFLNFHIDQQASLNISLYDLRDQYNDKDKLTSFFIKLGEKNETMIGSALLKGHYISFNLGKKTLMFSPLNRFSPEISTSELIRFLFIFILFMIFSCASIVVWQQCNMPKNNRHRYRRNEDGVKLVTYRKPVDFDDQD